MSLKDDKVPCARLCHIVKWDDFDGYGFNLHAERGKNGQFIGKVDDGSPSQAAGLKQGDRIIEVNEINIANETHKQVVDRIKAFPNETKLLVVDQEADDYFKANNIVIRGNMTNMKVMKTPEKNPASVEEDEEKPEGSISSAEETTKKSVASNDSATSDSTTTATIPNDENSRPVENSQENGHGSLNNGSSENGSNTTIEQIVDGHSDSPGNGDVPAAKTGLNLKMSAKELRAKLAARKKYDPKKETIGFKDKFDIVQKL